jgi:hypothetical protein
MVRIGPGWLYCGKSCPCRTLLDSLVLIQQQSPEMRRCVHCGIPPLSFLPCGTEPSNLKIQAHKVWLPIICSMFFKLYGDLHLQHSLRELLCSLSDTKISCPLSTFSSKKFERLGDLPRISSAPPRIASNLYVLWNISITLPMPLFVSALPPKIETASSAISWAARVANILSSPIGPPRYLCSDGAKFCIW